MGKSTKRQKPAKPHPDFPLSAHNCGQWCKKVKGRIYYFGRWEDPDGALELWLEQKDDLLAGRVPRAKREDATTLADVVNDFLTFKEDELDSGELAPATFKRYHSTCGFLVDHFGRGRYVEDITVDDFQALRRKMARRWGVVALGNEIQMIKTIFKHAWENELIKVPVRYGTKFDKPKQKALRKNRTKKGDRTLAPEMVSALLRESTPNMKAMILLALNSGISNIDLAEMKSTAIDLKNGWVNYPRVKTGVERRFNLWPETIQAIRDALENRSEPLSKDDEEFVFIGPRGKAYVGNYRITAEFKRIAKRAGVDRTFYDLRRTFETLGGESLDQAAVDLIMGHAPRGDDMAAVYRQRISDERLQRVTEHVRTSILGGKEAGNE